MVTRVTRSLLRRFALQVPYRPPAVWKGQVIALACVAGGAGLRFVLAPLVHDHIPVVVFYPFVLVASIWGGTLAGLSALVISALIADYFWLPPTGSLTITPDSAITLTAFAIVCLFGIGMARLLRALVELHVEGEERAILLAHEMKHRATNLLGVVQAISAQTARNATTVAQHQALFAARLAALGRAQRLIAEHPEAPPSLRDFLLAVIEPFGPERFRIEGPAVSVPLYLGPSCALLLHELCTNATKYGALSVPEGVVAIEWNVESDHARLVWRESQGPAVVEPERVGFGSRLLKTAFPSQYGQATVVFDPQGVRCTVYFALL